MDKIKISVGQHRTDARWKQVETTWGDFCDQCERAAAQNIGTETHEEYLALPKSRQDELKDVGGFIGGALTDGKRRRGCCTERQLITLDMDNCAAGSTEQWISAVKDLGFTYLIYSTRKHDPQHPRLRVIFPTDRPMTPDEYQPTARALASMLDGTLAALDRTTFEVERMMYWPSSSAGQATVLEYAPSGDEVPVDDLLTSTYTDWHDVAQWPACPGELPAIRAAAKQQDPTTKRGIVGAFCRVYDIPAAMDKFLPGEYVPAGGHRFTYTYGSTTGGAVTYDDDAFMFSHHATDPAGGRLVNSWDLVRLHRFGDQDGEAAPGTPTNRLPSFTAMCRLAEQDGPVAEVLHAERLSAAQEALDGFEDAQQDAVPDEAKDWHDGLAYNRSGTLLCTIQNMRLIIEHDPKLQGRIWVDRFASRLKCCGPFPWPGPEGERGWGDNDDAGLRWYFETAYHLGGVNKIFDATNIVAEHHARDPVCAYLAGLEWDGVPRLDTVFVDYLGATDTSYTRAVTRKAFTAAVARAFEPGYKFDQVVILSGPQGIGKSTILRKMGRKWFSDSINSFTGKDAREAIQGVWLIELGELTALDKSESEAAKQFISQTEDWFRPAYGRRSMQYPRRCVFFGTSNRDEFLRDSTGNRRYWPVDVGQAPVKASVFDDLDDDTVDQLWAEAVERYQCHERLYLDSDLSRTAIAIQEEHREEDPWAGMIREFIARPVPKDWASWDADARYSWWQGNYVDADQIETEERTRVCIAEIWCELMGQDKSRLDARAQRRIGAVLSNLEGWAKAEVQRCGIYGRQKAWAKNP